MRPSNGTPGNETHSDMVSKEILNQAKAFLCWDTFPGLTIQLIEMQQAVAFFYPPSKKPTIIQYYERGTDDFSIPLFQLFHEAGHFLQFIRLQQEGKEQDFWEIIEEPTGQGRIIFERESWDLGKNLLHDFIKNANLDTSLIKSYGLFAEQSLESYR
jgi:hypothetical protein